MNFSTNYDNIGGNEPLPVGKYECIVKEAFPSVTKNGKQYLDIRLVIRNDVNQKYQNRYIFHSIWKKNEPNDNDKQVDGYNYDMLMSFAQYAGLPAGKDYASVEDLCKDFVNKCVNVEVKHKESNGRTNARVKRCNKTAFPDCKHVFKAPAMQASNNSFQQPKQDAFAQPATAQVPVDLSDFEEIVGDEDVPF